MKLKPFPHREFVDTLTVGVGFAEEVRVKVEVDRTFVVEVVVLLLLLDIDECEFVHFPYFALHPVPQYAELLPQYPYWLQQFPNTEFKHVYPLLSPLVPSFDTTLGAGGEELHVPYPDWHPVPQYSEAVPQ